MFLILYCSIFKELCAALATAYLLYHIHSSLSSTFLKFFKFLFSQFWTFYQSVTVLSPFLPSGFLAHLRTLDCPLSRCSSGFRLSQVPSVFVPLVWVLIYYITLFELCQQLFHFNFAQMVLNCYIPRLCKMQTTTIYSFLLSTFSYQQPHCYMLKTRVFFP